MKKRLLFPPMILLFLLSACGSQGGSEGEELALTIRGEYLAMDRCDCQAQLTADYGQRVYDFTVSAAVEGEETTVTILQPEEAAGITARITEEGGALEYEGMSMETGPLDEEGLSPAQALPVLLEAARSDYMAECTLEEDGSLLRVRCADPTKNPGTGREVTLWFDAESHDLVRGEISADGMRVVRCEITQLTRQ